MEAERAAQPRLVKDLRRPSRELGGDPDRPVVSVFRLGAGVPAEFEASEDDVVVVTFTDRTGNVLASREGYVDVGFQERHPKEAPPYTRRIHSVRFNGARVGD